MIRLRIVVVAVAMLVLAGQAPAQQADADEGYRQAIRKRSADIAARLQLGDPDKQQKVQQILEEHYPKLREWHDANGAKLRDLEKQAAEASSAGDAARAEALKAQAAEVKQTLQRLHDEFVGKLGQVLTPAQVEGVKDGMTYNLANLRLETIAKAGLGLTADQQRQIRDILHAAREEAMDAGSAEEKHAIFRRAMGRIQVRVLDDQQRRALADSVKPPTRPSTAPG